MCRLIRICLLHVFEIKNVSFSQVIMPRIHKDWYEMVNQLEDASHGKVLEKNYMPCFYDFGLFWNIKASFVYKKYFLLDTYFPTSHTLKCSV